MYLTILKRKNVSLPLKVETDQFVICLVYQSVFLSKFVAFNPRTVNRIVTALMPSLLFRCFSFFLPHLTTLAQGERSENCLRFGTGGPSLCLYSFIVAKYIIFPRANNGCSRDKKKFLAKRYAHAISVHYRDFEHAYVY